MLTLHVVFHAINWIEKKTTVQCAVCSGELHTAAASVNSAAAAMKVGAPISTSGTVDTRGKAQQKLWHCHCHMLQRIETCEQDLI